MSSCWVSRGVEREGNVVLKRMIIDIDGLTDKVIHRNRKEAILIAKVLEKVL